MENVLAGPHFDICLIYLDEKIVKSAEFDSHIMHLRSVFEKIRKVNLKLSPQNVFYFNKRYGFLIILQGWHLYEHKEN